MKKLLFILFAAVIMIWTAGSISNAEVYQRLHVTQPPFIAAGPVSMNNNGDLAFSGWADLSSGYTQIYLYNGSSITQLTDTNDAFHHDYPQINDSGSVVWAGYRGPQSDIYLWDGSNIIQLTHGELYYESPGINNNGYVSWSGRDDPTTHSEIFLYDGANVNQLTNGGGNVGPQMNNNGYIVWSGIPNGATYLEIFLFDGVGISQITDNNVWDESPSMNDNGYVAWREWNEVDPTEAFLYDGSAITQLSDNSNNSAESININNSGSVVWSGWDGNDREIFLYNGFNVTQLTNDAYYDEGPSMNNDGYIVWERSSVNEDTEIFLYNGSSIIQLTNNTYEDGWAQINDNGYVTWLQRLPPDDPLQPPGSGPLEIMLAIPIPGFELNMTEMPWYENTPPHSSTGAAACQMILNYIREGAGEPLLSQDEIYTYAIAPLPYEPDLTPAEVSKALGHFDPYDYLVSNTDDVNDSLPGGNPYQGYNFGIDTYDPAADAAAMNNYMRDICHWMAYTVTQERWQDNGALVARPNTPAAIPIFGSYFNWIVVKGYVVSDNPAPTPHTDPWNTPDFTVYGFWIKDPQITGIGQDTYKTAAECESTYFLPLATGDGYHGLLLQVAEPPIEMSNANVEITQPDVKLSNLEFIGVRQKTESAGTAQYVDSPQSGQAAVLPQSWRDLVDQYLLTDSKAVQAFEGAEMGKPVLVARTDIDSSDYYLVPFGKSSGGGFATTAVIILDADKGYFKEASWTDVPSSLLKIDKDEALRLVIEKAVRYGKVYSLSDLVARLVWRPGDYSPSPYEPYWEVRSRHDLIFWYVTQDGRVIRDRRPIIKSKLEMY